MGPGEVDQVAKLVQIGQGLTVTGLLFVIVWAFYKNKVKTTEASVKEMSVLQENHNAAVKVLETSVERERVRGDKWETLSIELLEKAALATQTATEAVGQLQTSGRGRR